tara:strand:+ start:29 stop:1015 length:987 start_codon:yes stop_codon:yes gene_type:complete
MIGEDPISKTENPSDFDVVIVFPKRDFIPTKGERVLIDGKKADIMFCSEDEPNIVDSFIHLFSFGHYEEEKGIVQIDLHGGAQDWQVRHMPDGDELEIIKRAYCNRTLVDLNEPEGVLVTIHGLNTTAGWNSDIMPAFSSQGWIVAPFDYGFQKVEILVSRSGRLEVLNTFRDWIYDIHRTYNAPISVIAHSFGTYIIGAYLSGFKEFSPVSFETIILTGSILREDYDWESCEYKKVGRVRNEIAPNDQWVKWMPKNNWLGLDCLFGQAGVKGFQSKSRILQQYSNDIFDHNNVIRKDVIHQMWLPYIQSNKAVLMREFIAKTKIRNV